MKRSGWMALWITIALLAPMRPARADEETMQGATSPAPPEGAGGTSPMHFDAPAPKSLHPKKRPAKRKGHKKQKRSAAKTSNYKG